MKDCENGKKAADKRRNALSASFITGAIALVFLIVGYQVALFMNRAVRRKLSEEGRGADTVYVEAPYGSADGRSDRSPDGSGSSGRSYSTGSSGRSGSSGNSGRSDSTGSSGSPGSPGSSGSSGSSGSYGGSGGSSRQGGRSRGRRVENFYFDPNTVSVEDLQRLGFSERQAQSIVNYRLKGGRFRRPADFARSYVVADSVFRRLEPYIRIPKIDLNTADSAAFVTLPGVGGYFARKMVEYRERLGGYSYKEQLMDIYHFDSEKFDGLEDLICVDRDAVRPFRLWTLPEDSLALHPYIESYSAHGVVVFREHNPVENWTVENLDKAGILRPGMAEKLSRCVIANNL